MDLNSGGSQRATTTHKTKPDGSREVSHTVEHKSAVDALKRTRPTQQGKRSQNLHRNSDQLHHAIIARGMGGGDAPSSLADTLRMLKSVRLKADYGLPNAYTGASSQERPAPAVGLGPRAVAPEVYEQSPGFPQDEMAGRRDLSPVLTPQQAWLQNANNNYGQTA